MVEPSTRISSRHIGRTRHKIVPDRKDRRWRRKNVPPYKADLAADLPQKQNHHREYRVLQHDSCAPPRIPRLHGRGHLKLRRCRLLQHHHFDNSAGDKPDALATNVRSTKPSTFEPKSSLTQPSSCNSRAMVLMSATLVRKL